MVLVHPLPDPQGLGAIGRGAALTAASEAGETVESMPSGWVLSDVTHQALRDARRGRSARGWDRGYGRVSGGSSDAYTSALACTQVGLASVAGSPADVQTQLTNRAS